MSVVFEELIMIEEENSGQIICMDSDGKIRYKRENKELFRLEMLKQELAHVQAEKEEVRVKKKK